MESASNSMPTYQMQVIKFQKYARDEFDQISRDFLWQGFDSQKKIHIIGWKTIYNSKNMEVLGIRKENLMNQALLMKLA